MALFDIPTRTNSKDNDKKLAKKYEKAILKKGKNYVYLLLGDNPKDMEKKLLELAKK